MGHCKACPDELICIQAGKCQLAELPTSVLVATLNARGSRYGNFTDNAAESQRLKATLQAHPRFRNLDATKREALEMIAQKIARILNGDPEYKDNWHDIAGYATLAEERCAER